MSQHSFAQSSIEPQPPRLAHGIVRGVIAERYRISSETAPDVLAQRALSCLVQPQLGDQVLVTLHDDGAHVLAVLGRSDNSAEGATRIAVQGDLEIASEAGHVTMHGQKGLRQVTNGDAEVVAETLRVSAREGSMAVGALKYVGKEIHANVGQLRTLAESLESVATRVVQRADRVYRFIAESEQVRAHYLEWAAELAINIKSKNTIMRSTEMTKIDGQQIHLG